jgi:hypothetical protein
MTHEEFKNEMSLIDSYKLAEMAHSALSKLCSTGESSFKMSIPPRTDDTDIIFAEVIRRFEASFNEAKVGN